MASSIGHLDADCFYVSAERVRYPHIHNLPVGVLGNQGACVIAKSYEMKAAGVKTGMAIWDAAPLCPQAIFVKRDFQWYEVLSRKMLQVIRAFSPKVEYYSIDEMFFDAAGVDPWQLQQAILQQVGVPVSVGISLSKTLAKLATSSAKPFGVGVALDHHLVAALLRDRPVDEITGIARRSRRKLAADGIGTCEEFARADRRLIRKLLTKRGEELWWEINGHSVIPIQIKRAAHKFIARGGSVGRATADPDRIVAWVARNTERLIEALDYHLVFCQTLTLDLSFQPADQASRRISMPEATADFYHLLSGALEALEHCWQRGLAVHYMHLIAGDLTDRSLVQRGMFGQLSPRDKTIAQVKRQINQKLGRFTLRSALTVPLADVYRDEANAYDICDVYGKSCF